MSVLRQALRLSNLRRRFLHGELKDLRTRNNELSRSIDNWERKYDRVRAALDPHHTIPEHLYSLVQVARLVYAGLDRDPIRLTKQIFEEARKIQQEKVAQCI